MLLLFVIPIWLFIVIYPLIYRQNYYFQWDIPFYINLIIVIVLIAFVIKIKIRDFHNNPIKLFPKIVLAILFCLPVSLNFTQLSYHFYTYIFGIEINYIAEVVNKKREPQRDKIHFYISVNHGLENKRLDNSLLYFKVDVHSKLLIKQKISSLGSYIKYDDIEIVQK